MVMLKINLNHINMSNLILTILILKISFNRILCPTNYNVLSLNGVSQIIIDNTNYYVNNDTQELYYVKDNKHHIVDEKTIFKDFIDMINLS